MCFGSCPGPRVGVHPHPWWCYYRCPFPPHLTDEQSWHLTLWLGERDSSFSQNYRIWCFWLFLHLFFSCSPSTANTCSFFCLSAGCSCLFLYFWQAPCCRCSPSATLQLLRLLLTPCSVMAPPALQLCPPFPWLLFCDSASPLCLKEGPKTICSIFVSQIEHLILFLLQKSRA